MLWDNWNWWRWCGYGRDNGSAKFIPNRSYRIKSKKRVKKNGSKKNHRRTS